MSYEQPTPPTEEEKIQQWQQAIRHQIDVIWSRIVSVSTKHDKTAPGIHVGLVEEVALTLDDDTEIIYREPISATTAYNYIADLTERQQGSKGGPEGEQ
jgi:hypothetical protein